MTAFTAPELIPGAKVITQVYSTSAKGHDIKVNTVVPLVLLKAQQEVNAPILIAWHGGGLIDGSREDPYVYEPILGEYLCPRIAASREVPELILPQLQRPWRSMGGFSSSQTTDLSCPPTALISQMM